MADPSQQERFSCPDCGRTFVTLKGLNLHQRRYCLPQVEPAPAQPIDTPPEAEVFSCPGCSRQFPSKNSLSQHQRRYCRPNADPDNTCNDCLRTFPTFAGLQQHRRKAHSARYQAVLEAADKRKVEPFSQLETLHVAQAEIAHTGTTPINKYLAERFQRPVENIRNLRKLRRYLELRTRLERERNETPDHLLSSLPRFEDLAPATPRTPPSAVVWPSPPADEPSHEDPGLVTMPIVTRPDSPAVAPSDSAGSPPAGPLPTITIGEDSGPEPLLSPPVPGPPDCNGEPVDGGYPPTLFRGLCWGLSAGLSRHHRPEGPNSRPVPTTS